jgi:serine/threonine protein phosphatase 1
MLSLLKRIAKGNLPPPSIGVKGRVYAVGDVHGRFDLFVRMLHAIGQDLSDHPASAFQIVFLGDLIDRGPQSSKIITLANALSQCTSRLRFLKGNHEELLLRSLAGDERTAEFYYDIGGRETLMSYGFDTSVGDKMPGDQLVRWMQDNIPIEHANFIEGFQDLISSGDYIFVHAGLRPNVPLDKQTTSDLRWIRKDFIHHEGNFPGIVVHGHSVTRDADERPNRIGVDTGAYFSGKLTAVALEADQRRFISVSAEGWDETEQEQEFSYIFAAD